MFSCCAGGPSPSYGSQSYAAPAPAPLSYASHQNNYQAAPLNYAPVAQSYAGGPPPSYASVQSSAVSSDSYAVSSKG